MSRRLLLWLLFPKWNSNESSRKSKSLWISCIFLVKIAICNRMANYLGLCVRSVCSGRQKVTGKWGDYLRLWHMPRGLLSAANIRLNTIQKLNWIGQGEARHPPFCPQFILCRPLALKSCQILLHTHTHIHSSQRGKMEMQMRISNLNSNTKSNRNPKSVCIVYEYNDHILPVCPLFFYLFAFCLVVQQLLLLLLRFLLLLLLLVPCCICVPSCFSHRSAWIVVLAATFALVVSLRVALTYGKLWYTLQGVCVEGVHISSREEKVTTLSEGSS